MKKIGMRNAKTGFSVFICVAFFKLLNIGYPFYACIAAIICMQNSVSGSFKVGKNRMIGTFIGAVIGFLCALISPGNALLCFVGIVIIIYICTLLNLNNSVVIGCIVFVAIMTNLRDVTPFTYSYMRLLETFIGISITVTVNYFLNPPNILKNLEESSNKIINHISSTTKDYLQLNKDIDINELSNEISNFEKYLKTYKSEIRYNKHDKQILSELETSLDYFKKISLHLNIISSLKHIKNDTVLDFHISELLIILSYFNIQIEYTR
ncbi:MAG: aromatic acid exporter family protein [Clostridiaceae bacterium]